MKLHTENRIRDLYRTPEWCYEKLISLVNFSLIYSALEPCAGDGRIAKWLTERGVEKVHQQDISAGQDYLAFNHTQKYGLIMTNPPYNLSLQITRKAIAESQCTILLLRLGFLASQQRYSLFQKHPLTALYVLSKRPSFKFGTTDNSEYAWFVWDTLDCCAKGIHHIL